MEQNRKSRNKSVTYGQFIFDKAGKNIQWGKKNNLFKKMVLGKLDSDMEKNEAGPLPYTNTKINSKWIKDLKGRPETIKNPRRKHRQ